MEKSKPTLTPFEKAEASRAENLQRIACTLLVATWMARIRELRKAHIRMSTTEKLQWDAAIQMATEKHFERFGYEA